MRVDVARLANLLLFLRLLLLRIIIIGNLMLFSMSLRTTCFNVAVVAACWAHN